VLDRARAEQWKALLVLGPGVSVSDEVENCTDFPVPAKNVFQLIESSHGLANKLMNLPLSSAIKRSDSTELEVHGDAGSSPPRRRALTMKQIRTMCLRSGDWN